jgi:hypothetical protein
MKRRPVLTRLPLALQLVLYECPILHGSMDHGVVCCTPCRFEFYSFILLRPGGLRDGVVASCVGSRERPYLNAHPPPVHPELYSSPRRSSETDSEEPENGNTDHAWTDVPPLATFTVR